MKLTTKQTKKLLDAINWLMGCGESFEPEFGQRVTRYWWRKQFREKSGIVYDSKKFKYKFNDPSKSLKIK